MEPLHVISLGAGVQSSTMALMATRGELSPLPHAAIFADTQGEPASVYAWLTWLESQLSFPVIRATAGNLIDDASRLRTSRLTNNTYLRPSLPVFTIGADGKPGMMMRQCTRDYKITVVRRESKRLAAKGQRIIHWIGISSDEATRMKPSNDKRIENIWPLLDKGISRTDCLAWMQRNSYPRPPRSACVYCPYHNDTEWLRLKNEEPEEFARAIALEKQLSSAVGNATALKAKACFFHSSRVPLDQVKFDDKRQTNKFENECEGMCGV